jgi:hypothetical protein
MRFAFPVFTIGEPVIFSTSFVGFSFQLIDRVPSRSQV